MSPGKQFEQAFQSSADSDKHFIYRFKDSAASFGQGQGTRFTPSNICDYLLLDNDSRTMYLLELKSVKGSSLPFSNIRQNQIKELTKASKYNIICGFVVNFRERDNTTLFLNIKDFNSAMESWEKKSMNMQDIIDNGGIEIKNKKMRTRYKYDLIDFIGQTKFK